MAEKTALILIDVYNDFLHSDGKATGALAASLAASHTIENLQKALKAARSAKIPIFYSLHQQYHEGKYHGFQHWNGMLRSVQESHSFEEGSFGAEIYKGLEPDPKNGDVVISKHWNQSSFHNTDLDWLLHQRDINHLVFAGLVANTCIETTARMANEQITAADTKSLCFKYPLGIKDCGWLCNWTDWCGRNDTTAGWTIDQMKAAVDYSWPSFAHGVLSTEEWTKSLV